MLVEQSANTFPGWLHYHMKKKKKKHEASRLQSEDELTTRSTGTQYCSFMLLSGP